MLNKCWPEGPLCSSNITWWSSYLWKREGLSQVFCALKDFFSCSIASKGATRTKEVSNAQVLRAFAPISLTWMQKLLKTRKICKAPTDAASPMLVFPVLRISGQSWKVKREKQNQVTFWKEQALRQTQRPVTGHLWCHFLLAWGDNGKLTGQEKKKNK